MHDFVNGDRDILDLSLFLHPCLYFDVIKSVAWEVIFKEVWIDHLFEL